MQPSTQVDLSVSCAFLTHDTSARILIATIEFLLFHRNQMPFSFDTFKFMVRKFEKLDTGDWNNYLIAKQRDLAESMLNSINTVSMSITEVFRNTDITEVLILFGTTLASPVETYHVKLPTVTRDHSPENHISATTHAVKQILVGLTISSELQKNLNDLKQTNMFVLVKHDESSSNSEDFSQKTNFFIPQRCRKYVINIENKTDDGAADMKLPDCCKYLNVYSESHSMVPKEVEKQRQRDDLSSDVKSWFASQVVVKGFKDVLVKGKSIWD